jgi:hypothetical protein
MGFEDFLGPPGEEGAMPAKDIRTAIRLLFSPGSQEKQPDLSAG